MSGLHYGCYKAHDFRTLISTVKCHLINLAVKNGTPLGRWKRDLSVMLEKHHGIFLVEKLRALALLKADFNALHTINFNGRLMPSLESSFAITQEIIGGRRLQAATHLALSKKQ